ncbi:Uncharacterised protein [Escherichia coli]|nr:Uncharacterised protein [Escherichia coli]CAD6111417.1 Uncharacterised protein [Escherichia coli]CAD6181146.1 Uncharacterised protein [Escherichia coli]
MTGKLGRDLLFWMGAVNIDMVLASRLQIYPGNGQPLTE